MKLTPRLVKTAINLWPPFLGAGIRVRHIAKDWRHIEVRLRLRLTNRNIMGVHFGGSLYAMTDPFFMFMVMQTLGRDFVVWDKAGHIEYIKPGRGLVTATFRLSEAQSAAILAAAAHGDKTFPELSVDIVDQAGDIVARVHKTLYVRKKKGR